jgi:CRISPR-associated protein Csx10
MEQVKITITVKSPTLIASSSTAGVLTATRGSIDGRILRGVFASHFIKSHNLCKEAHKNQEFMDLFYGDLRFVSAYKDTVKGTSFPAPLSLQKFKNAAKDTGFVAGDVVDSYYAENKSDWEPKKRNLLGFKGLKGFIIQDGTNCSSVQIETAIRLHMSRSSEKERIQGRSKDGNIFNYEFLEPNQVFVGTVIGPKTALESFVHQFPKKLDCYIGRSRYTEYGHCELEVGGITSIPTPTSTEDSVYVRLHTPLLVGNESIVKVISDAVQEIGSDISIGGVHASYQEEQNFNSIWGVRSSSESAASAGSVIKLVKASGWTQENLAKLQHILYNGMGSRVQEGYGQGRLWTPGEFKMVKLEEPKITGVTSLHQSTKELTRKILEKQVILNARLRAANDVDTYIKPRFNVGGQAKHFTTVLLFELGMERKSGYRKLKDFVAKIQKDDKILAKNLKPFNIKHEYTSETDKYVNLMDYIITFDKNMLLDACLSKSGESGEYYEIPTELVDMIGINKEEFSKIVVYEYWLYFFRHIRKIQFSRIKKNQ